MEDRSERTPEQEEAAFKAHLMAMPAQKRRALMAWMVEHAEEVMAVADRVEDPETAALRAEAARQGKSMARLVGEQVAADADAELDDEDDDYWTPEPIQNEAVAEWMAEQ